VGEIHSELATGSYPLLALRDPAQVVERLVFPQSQDGLACLLPSGVGGQQGRLRLQLGGEVEGGAVLLAAG
jgi:hypothetical protein